MKTQGTSPIIIKEIRRLSQEEGLKDSEIADIIKYNRVTVQKIRKSNNIPTCNLFNRKDKIAVCTQCQRKYFIRRCEKAGMFCPICEEIINRQIEDNYCKME